MLLLASGDLSEDMNGLDGSGGKRKYYEDSFIHSKNLSNISLALVSTIGNTKMNKTVSILRRLIASKKKKGIDVTTIIQVRMW